uniref:DLG associated protein 4 n=1 Tax=Cyprinus carpio TaxID=7962 RepID=A0A8C2F381_CYPCA
PLKMSLYSFKSKLRLLLQSPLFMPSTGDWMGTLGRSGPMGEIPCRRMRSGSYVKAMADLEDSDDSDGSPKPSPKSTARRQSYLRATQQSLTACGHSLISHLFSSLCDPCPLPVLSCLTSLREYSGNRSLDNLDCIGGSSPFPNWDDDDFSQGCSTLGRGSCISQVRPLMTFDEPPDMPMPTCFRSRSHSYLRAIQAGCSQDDDTASVDSDSPPPTTTTTVRTYSNSTGEEENSSGVSLLQKHLKKKCISRFDGVAHCPVQTEFVFPCLKFK